MTLTVAQIQFDVVSGDSEINRRQVLPMIEEAAGQGAELICLPEMWLTGMPDENCSERAITKTDPFIKLLAEMAASFSIHLQAGSFLLREGDNYFNSAVWFSPTGQVPVFYHKIHLFGLMDEPRYLTSGSTPITVDTPWGVAGLAVCYDLRFPELFRHYGIKERAVMVFLPAQWPAARIDHWKILCQARAIENQCFIIATNRIGWEGKTRFGGSSMVINPWGEIISDAANESGVMISEIDLDDLVQARQKLTVLDDTRL